MASGDPLSFETTLEQVEELHCLIGRFVGPCYSVDTFFHFPEIYRMRETSRRLHQLSYYDVHWLREWRWLCICRGPFEYGCGCSMEWRRRGWICPELLGYL